MASRSPLPCSIPAARIWAGWCCSIRNTGKEKTVFAGTAILQKPAWMPDNEHIIFVFHDATSDWNGQVGEISIAAGKLHRITNDLNSYSNLTLGVTKDGKQLIAIQLAPQASIYVMSSDANANATPTPVSSHGETGGWAGCPTAAW